MRNEDGKMRVISSDGRIMTLNELIQDDLIHDLVQKAFHNYSRLIAAAPGLLRELSHIADALETGAFVPRIEPGSAKAKSICAAVAKAKGTDIATNATKEDLYDNLPAGFYDLLRELGGIAGALEDGETVLIEPGSVKAASIHAAITKVEDN